MADGCGDLSPLSHLRNLNSIVSDTCVRLDRHVELHGPPVILHRSWHDLLFSSWTLRVALCGVNSG